MRELIVVLLLGFFIGLSVGYHFAYKTITPIYQADLKRIEEQNNYLFKLLLGQEVKKK